MREQKKPTITPQEGTGNHGLTNKKSPNYQTNLAILDLDIAAILYSARQNLGPWLLMGVEWR